MAINNLTGLEKPLQKLVEVVAEGIGETTNAIFELDVKKIKRIGAAEAEVEKNKIIKRAEGNMEALQVRAEKRFALEQYNKQVNLENIIVGAKEKLIGATVSDKPVDKDWTFKFMNIAQDVSREDMQKLLSKILAEEIKNPNSFSLRTLDFVKNLSKEELILFRKIAIISNLNLSIYMTKSNANEGFSGITYGEIMKLIEIDFVQPSLTTVLNLGDIQKDTVYPLALKNRNYLFKFTEEQKSLHMPVLQLTTIGTEVSSLIEIEAGDDKIISKYVEDLKEFWKTKKLEFIA